MDRALLLLWSLAIVCSSFTVVVCNTEVSREFLDALREIESVGVGGVCAVGDDGRSLGAYQIMKAYHTDAVEQNPDLSAEGKTYTDVWGEGSVDYSEEVVRAYMCRYATEARLGHPPTYEDMARIYNGGPNGHTDNGTLEYWERFQVILGNIQQRGTQEPPVLESDECDPRCESDQCCREDDRGQYRCFCLEELDGTGARHMERPCEDCPVAGIDLVFVLDSSGSVGSSNFQLIREFVADITADLDIGPDNTQVGVIVFSSNAAVQFSLNTYSAKSQLLSAIAAIPFTSGGTNTASALNLLLTHGFLGARPTSQGVPRVVIVVTDGISNNPSATAAAAQAVHATGVTVFAAGIGNANTEELNAIASRPEFVQLIGGFSVAELQQLQETLSGEACRASTEPDIEEEIERSLGLGSKAFLEYQVPVDGFTMRVEVTEGAISVCGSREIERPDCSYSPTYDWRRDITTSAEVYISGSVNATTVHVTVEGLDTDNTFSLDTTLDIDECSVGLDNCHEFANCIDTKEDFNCTCFIGYEGNGTACNDIDECEGSVYPCHSDADCTNFNGSFSCACRPGYSGNGMECTNIDECSVGLDNCHGFANCIDTKGDFNCTCFIGYEGNGTACNDIDECEGSVYPCHSDADCTNFNGSFSCACRPGYSGNGMECTNIDECGVGLDNCHEFANCIDTKGNFNCTCFIGYEGNGTACNDIDECEGSVYPCHNDADCTNFNGSFSCECRPGYSGNGMECTNIDECSVGLDNCHEFANCNDTKGVFNCTCFNGYEGNGTACNDIDECEGSVYPCHSDADCTNFNGSFSCECRPGYSGDGMECTRSDELPIIAAGVGGGVAILLLLIVIISVLCGIKMSRINKKSFIV